MAISAIYGTGVYGDSFYSVLFSDVTVSSVINISATLSGYTSLSGIVDVTFSGTSELTTYIFRSSDVLIEFDIEPTLTTYRFGNTSIEIYFTQESIINRSPWYPTLGPSPAILYTFSTGESPFLYDETSGANYQPYAITD